MEYTWSLQGNVLTPTGVIQNATIYVKGTRIDALDAFAQRPITAEVKSIDARGYLIAPGYIDAHPPGGNGPDFLHASAGEIAAVPDFIRVRGRPDALECAVQTKPGIDLAGKIARRGDDGFQGGAHIGVPMSLAAGQRARVAAQERKMRSEFLAERHGLLILPYILFGCCGGEGNRMQATTPRT